jgi:hypothetical protein
MGASGHAGGTAGAYATGEADGTEPAVFDRRQPTAAGRPGSGPLRESHPHKRPEGLVRGQRHCKAVRGSDPQQDAVIAAKDSAGLEDDQEIVATLERGADALLRTALHDFERSQ